MRERETSGCSACKGASRRVGGGGEGGHSGRGLCLYTPSTQDRLSLPRHLRGDRALPSGTSFRRQECGGGGGSAMASGGAGANTWYSYKHNFEGRGEAWPSGRHAVWAGRPEDRPFVLRGGKGGGGVMMQQPPKLKVAEDPFGRGGGGGQPTGRGGGGGGGGRWPSQGRVGGWGGQGVQAVRRGRRWGEGGGGAMLA